MASHATGSRATWALYCTLAIDESPVLVGMPSNLRAFLGFSWGGLVVVPPLLAAGTARGFSISWNSIGLVLGEFGHKKLAR